MVNLAVRPLSGHCSLETFVNGLSSYMEDFLCFSTCGSTTCINILLLLLLLLPEGSYFLLHCDRNHDTLAGLELSCWHVNAFLPDVVIIFTRLTGPRYLVCMCV